MEIAHSVNDAPYEEEQRRPGSSKKPLEETIDTLRRLCEEQLGWDFDALHLMLNKSCVQEVLENAGGLPTLYRKHVYFANVAPASMQAVLELQTAAEESPTEAVGINYSIEPVPSPPRACLYSFP